MPRPCTPETDREPDSHPVPYPVFRVPCSVFVSTLRPNLIVFDLDGTLVDSLEDLADAANELLQRHGAPPLEDDLVASMVGEGAAKLVGRVLEARGLSVPRTQALEAFLSIYDRRLIEHTRPYDGMVKALDALGDVARLAVLTNKPLAASERILEALGLADRFMRVIGGDGPFPRKPAPDGLLALIEEAAASPDQTVLVGDSAVDLRTARNAGTRICLARYGFGFARCRDETWRGDELFVDRPSELPKVLLASSGNP